MILPNGSIQCVKPFFPSNCSGWEKTYARPNADFAWVEREIEKSLPDVQTEILSCAASVSTGRSGEIANWLIDWPDVIGSDAIFSAVSSRGLRPGSQRKGTLSNWKLRRRGLSKGKKVSDRSRPNPDCNRKKSDSA